MIYLPPPLLTKEGKTEQITHSLWRRAGFNRVIIIGVGHIGSSIGLNLPRRGLVGVDVNPRNLRRSISKKVVQKGRVLRNVKDILKLDLGLRDLVILAAPVRSIQGYLKILPRGPLIMDVGSAKGEILKIANRRRLRFVGAHPIAGKESSGPNSADRSLFKGRLCLLTPARGVRPPDVRAIAALWHKMGSKPLLMRADRHDRLLSILSHLPHAAAYSLIRAVGKMAGPKNASLYAWGGLKDTTRIASSSPRMWTDIFLANRRELLGSLKGFQRELVQLYKMILQRNEEKIERWLREGQSIRNRF